MLRSIKYLASLALAIAMIAGCDASGPKKTLDEMARALETNNQSAFLACIDMDAFASNRLKGMAGNDAALDALNRLGAMFGLGNLEDFLDNLIDVKGSLEREFARGAASGELAAQCRVAITPDCPWVPQSLREAAVTELGKDAAIAKIVTPAKITSWLALHKFGDKWLVVGQSVMEDRARAQALDANRPQTAPPAGAPVKKQNREAPAASI